MISRLGQAMPRFLAGASVAGDGMRERLRTATFALFGMVTAIGLVLVGIAYNQGWPDFADSPIPGIPTERVGEATVAADAVHRHARSGNGAASARVRAPAEPGRRRPARPLGRRSRSSHQQLPATGAGRPGPRPGSVGAGRRRRAGVSRAGAGPPGRRAAAPPAPVAAQPAPARRPGRSVAAGLRQSPADAASVPGNGKAKGHEKAGKPKPGEAGRKAPRQAGSGHARRRRRRACPLPGRRPRTPAPAAGPGNGNGKGNANGHEQVARAAGEARVAL